MSITPKFAVIGPVAPYRGGIAQHTAMLCRALSHHVDIFLLSFSRQYPAWLYPGTNDRDITAAPMEDPTPHFVIDALNPVTWNKAAAMVAAQRPNLVIIPWWTAYWAPCFWYIARYCRRNSLNVLFFCHNVNEHESTGWKIWLTRLVLKQGTCFAVHTREDEANLKRLLPTSRILVHPHPIYEQFPIASELLPRRAELELLFFGLIRPYKGLDVLIEAMGLLKNESVHLTIAGEFWSGRNEIEERILELGVQNQIEIVARYITDQEASNYFTRADAVVLPYRSATGSGVIAAAYHFDKPVIVTRVGGLPEVVIDGQTGLIVSADSPRELADAIKTLLEKDEAELKAAIRDMKKTMTWDHLAGNLTSLI